jgi:hypothetical protein
MEEFLGLAHLAPLEMPHLDRQPLDAAGEDCEGAEIGGVAIARDDLGRNRLDREAEFFRDIHLDAGIDAPEIAQVAISARAASTRARLRANSA